MKLPIRSSLLTGGVVALAVLASSVVFPSSRASAQSVGFQFGNTRYHNPYGQGRYGGYSQYGQGNHGHDAYGRSIYRYPSYGTTTYRYGSRYSYGGSPYTRSYGGSTYYQPYYGGSQRLYGGSTYYQPNNGRIYFGFGL